MHLNRLLYVSLYRNTLLKDNYTVPNYIYICNKYSNSLQKISAPDSNETPEQTLLLFFYVFSLLHY